MVETGHAIELVQHEVRAQRRELRYLRMRFEAAAEIIGDIARKPALERRQLGHMGLAVRRHHPVDERQRIRILWDAIEDRLPAPHLQRVRRVAGEKRIAPEMFGAHHAFQQGEMALPLQPQREGRRFQADDFAGFHIPHDAPI